MGSKDEEEGKDHHGGLHLPGAQVVLDQGLLGALLSASLGPQLCSGIYKKRRTRKSQDRGQNAVLWL